MEQSPSWKANSSSACQEFPHISMPPNYHNSVHNGPIPSQINPVHAFPSYFLNIDFNLSPIYALVYQAVSFFQVSPTQPCMQFYFPSQLPRLPHLFLITRTLSGEEQNIIWWRAEPVRILTILNSPVPRQPSSTQMLPSSLSSNFGVMSPLSVTDQVSHPQLSLQMQQ